MSAVTEAIDKTRNTHTLTFRPHLTITITITITSIIISAVTEAIDTDANSRAYVGLPPLPTTSSTTTTTTTPMTMPVTQMHKVTLAVADEAALLATAALLKDNHMPVGGTTALVTFICVLFCVAP
jgi:hypothetical protein